MKFKIILVMLFVVMFMSSACSHTFNIKNLNTYRTLGLGYQEELIRLGLMTNTSCPVECEYIRSIGRSLQNSGCASRVFFPYNLSSHKKTSKADIIVRINPSINYSGSGWNFLINWPGFLIFAPAWNGYIYHADMEFKISISDGKTKEQIDNFIVPIRYNIRHAAINRTWTVGVGWCECGIAPFIGGFFFTGYDDDVTELLLYRVKEDVGNYVAEKITSRLANYLPDIK